MARQARVDVPPAPEVESVPEVAVAWRAPPGWIAPEWLAEEPEPASLPMTKDRMEWCLHALGWSLMELARRVHTHELSIRQMARGRRDIPDVLAVWLEQRAAHSLADPPLPDGWRSKPE